MGKRAMSPKRLFNLLMALTVAAGLLSAPFSTPAVAKAHPAAAGGEMHAMAGDMPTMAGMPCCPDGKANDCDSCPLLAVCMLTISIAPPSGASTLAKRETSGETITMQNDAWIDGLGGHPPDHPPRNNV
jgi:hypothetical protein